MVEAILILNIIILVAVLLMVPVVLGTSQDLNSRKADSRKIREVHNYVYELMRRELVQEQEAEIAEMKKHFEEGGGWYPDVEVDGEYHSRREESVTEAEAVAHVTKEAREAMYHLDCKKHAYMAFSNGTDLKWPDGESNLGWALSGDWRYQTADMRMHESFDNE